MCYPGAGHAKRTGRLSHAPTLTRRQTPRRRARRRPPCPAASRLAQAAPAGRRDDASATPNAPVTLVEYAMFTCPHCAAFNQEVFPQIKANYIDTGKVRLVFREVYFNKPSLWAAMIARCAPSDRYFGIADLLFARRWTGRPATDEQAMVGKLYRIGRQAGMTDAQMDACLKDRGYRRGAGRRLPEERRGRRRRRDADVPDQRPEGRQHALGGVRQKLDAALGA